MFAGVVAVVVLPFLIADPVAFYEDTVKFGAGTYKIVGYGLSAMLIRAGILDDRDGSYPFALIALLTWLPLTAWLLRTGTPRARAVGGRGGLLDLDPGAAVHRPHLQQLLPRVADDGRAGRRAGLRGRAVQSRARSFGRRFAFFACSRGSSAYRYERPVR